MIKKVTTILILILMLFYKETVFSDEVPLEIFQTSIRENKDEIKQGLRFYSKIKEAYKNKQHGFYLLYGEASLDDLLNAKDSDNFTFNDKVIYDVNVIGVSDDLTFSVVLTDIPENGYLDSITVISYVIVDGLYVYSDAYTTSVIDVALKLANKDELNQTVSNVLNILKTKRRLALHPIGFYEITNDLFENDIIELRKIFIQEYNQKYKTTHLEINNDINEDDLFSYINTPRWSWLNDYFLSLNENYNTFNKIIVKNIVISFFNQLETEYINFTYNNHYLTLNTFNDQIYIYSKNYYFFDDGDEVILKTNPLNDSILKYHIDDQVFNVGDLYLVNGNKTIHNLIEEIDIIYRAKGYPFNQYQLISHSKGVIISDEKDYKDIVLTITPVFGYIFDVDVLVNTIYDNGYPTKVKEFSVEPNKIVIRLDDPNWTVPV